MEIVISWDPGEEEHAKEVVGKIAKTLYGVDEPDPEPPRGLTITRHEYGGGYSIYP